MGLHPPSRFLRKTIFVLSSAVGQDPVRSASIIMSTIASTPFHDLERGFETEALDEAAEIPEYEFDFDDDGSGEDEGDFRED